MLDKKNFYINGAWVKPNSSEEIKVIDPATEEDCAVITLGNKADVDIAVNAAKDAYETWAFSSKEERIALLEKLYENYKKRWADIAEAITLEMGAPKDFATKLQAGTGASHIKSFIRYLTNVVLPTPISPLKNKISPGFILQLIFLATSSVFFSEDMSILLPLVAISIWFERTLYPNAYVVRLLF